MSFRVVVVVRAFNIETSMVRTPFARSESKWNIKNRRRYRQVRGKKRQVIVIVKGRKCSWLHGSNVLATEAFSGNHLQKNTRHAKVNNSHAGIIINTVRTVIRCIFDSCVTARGALKNHVEWRRVRGQARNQGAHSRWRLTLHCVNTVNQVCQPTRQLL